MKIKAYNPIPSNSFSKATKEPAFGGMHLDKYIKDLRIQDCYGEKVQNMLPQNIQNTRKNIIDEITAYINSKDFNINVFKKNWVDKEETIWSMEYLKNSDFLKERANILLTKTYLNLKEIYKNVDTIIIPFSGGRDSSSLLSASLAFFPEKKYKLVTVLNGMSENTENVIQQANYIKEKFSQKGKKLNIEHICIDASENTKKYVVDTAKQDAQKIDAPAICSSCKIVMEKEIWNYIIKQNTSFMRKLFKKKPPVLMGYTINQQNQNWLEQTKTQIGTMQKEAKKFGIQTVSPLFNIIEEPYDSSILLGSLGIPLNHHKSEMKCLAGGLNPKTINLNKLILFTEEKNKQTKNIPKDKKQIFYYNPAGYVSAKNDLRTVVQELKKDKEYTDGAFQG